MVNAQFAMHRWGMHNKHILPFHATSTIGARWLKQKGYKPDIIFLDSAHEQDETIMEIEMYYELLGDGGILYTYLKFQTKNIEFRVDYTKLL